ncbi:MAG TPA: LiaF domain-containing protein [Kofleriaceae bacterium]|nr:LiaF domain-containing protein [Kofleriaceae bacterium]
MAESLVALRDRRHQVIARLSECFATDVLEVDELERRLDLAHAARTVAELEELVADLAPVLAPVTTTALAPVASTAIEDPSRAERKKLRVVMSHIERKGRWTVPRTLELRVLWGNTELDFRDASLAPGTTTIDVRVLMGNLEIILPPHLAVDVDVSSFMGSVEERHRVPPDADPARPLLRLTGAVRLGNLEITTRLPGETAGDASRRERRERKQLRKAQQRELAAGKDGDERDD